MNNPPQIINFSLPVEDILVISEALAERPFKLVNQTIQRMQAQINQQQLADIQPASPEKPDGE